MKEIIFIIAIFSFIPLVYAQEYPDLGVKVETVAEYLDIPWSIVWTPEGTIFFTERTGQLRAIQDGKVLEQPVLSLEVGRNEGGLLGMTLDPKYSENHYLYLYFTYHENSEIKNKVIRYVVSDLILKQDKVIIDDIPGGPTHDGGRIKFGPDGKLYITTGDAGNGRLAQELSNVAGILQSIHMDTETLKV